MDPDANQRHIRLHHIILDRISQKCSRNVTTLLNVGLFSPRYTVHPLKLIMSASETTNL